MSRPSLLRATAGFTTITLTLATPLAWAAPGHGVRHRTSVSDTVLRTGSGLEETAGQEEKSPRAQLAMALNGGHLAQGVYTPPRSPASPFAGGLEERRGNFGVLTASVLLPGLNRIQVTITPLQRLKRLTGDDYIQAGRSSEVTDLRVEVGGLFDLSFRIPGTWKTAQEKYSKIVGLLDNSVFSETGPTKEDLLRIILGVDAGGMEEGRMHLVDREDPVLSYVPNPLSPGSFEPQPDRDYFRVGADTQFLVVQPLVPILDETGIWTGKEDESAPYYLVKLAGGHVAGLGPFNGPVPAAIDLQTVSWPTLSKEASLASGIVVRLASEDGVIEVTIPPTKRRELKPHCRVYRVEEVRQSAPQPPAPAEGAGLEQRPITVIPPGGEIPVIPPVVRDLAPGSGIAPLTIGHDARAQADLADALGQATEIVVIDPAHLYYTTPEVGAAVAALVQEAQRRLPWFDADADQALVSRLLTEGTQPVAYSIVVKGIGEAVPGEDQWVTRHAAVVELAEGITFAQIIQQALSQWAGRSIGQVLGVQRLEDGRLAVYV